MPTDNVPPTDTAPPVITAAAHLVGLQRPAVNQLEHGLVAIRFTNNTGSVFTLTGPLPELRSMLVDTDRQLQLVERSGPSH